MFEEGIGVERGEANFSFFFTINTLLMFAVSFWGDRVAQLLERLDSIFKDPRFEPYQEHEKKIASFSESKILW